ncbi:hypothetical protein [Pedobacter frigoris]|uniref:hypothetical protein n=1 Tax=Pedobacter frigoris TaxID=2571272 RepID=UPI00292D44A6|nr:hypothetical protein [Pedobacter frigoris]
MKTLFKLFAIPVLCLAIVSCEKNVNTKPEEDLYKGSIDISLVPTEVNSSRPTTSTQWGKHWNHGGINCGGIGLYCIRRLKAFEGAEKLLENGETFGVPVVEISGNNIRIITVGQGGKPSDEVLQSFKNKKIEIPSSGLPPEIVEALLSNLKARSIEKVVFEPAHQKYEVVDANFEGKPVTIIAAFQKTEIDIDGKSYNLLVITTSGKSSERLKMPTL